MVVYTLWKHPSIIPLLHTPEFVLQKLKTGAPLMTPGIQRGPPFPSKATKGAVVAIASLEKPSVPEVVGVCEIDVAALQNVQGAKGHAVRGEHWLGDELWAWSQNGIQGRNAPDDIKGWDMDNEAVALNTDVSNLALEEADEDHEDGGVELTSLSEERDRKNNSNPFVEGEEVYEEVHTEDKAFSTKGRLSSLLDGVKLTHHRAR